MFELRVLTKVVRRPGSVVGDTGDGEGLEYSKVRYEMGYCLVNYLLHAGLSSTLFFGWCSYARAKCSLRISRFSEWQLGQYEQ